MWVALVALAVAAWGIWFRPVTLGGSATYIVVKGTSMEPTYRDGDLVVIQEQDRYGIGDVVAFKIGGRFDNPTLVIHRIVGGDGESGYVTQGDNRDVTDPWSPTDETIIGAASFDVPKFGAVVEHLKRPDVLAALGGTLAATGFVRQNRRRRRRDQRAREPRQDVDTQPMHQRSEGVAVKRSRVERSLGPAWAVIALAVAATIAVPVVILGVAAVRADDSDTHFEETGAYEYGVELVYAAHADPSPVYPDGVVRSTSNAAGAVAPDGPLYANLIESLEVTLAFAASGTGVADGALDSRYSVSLEVATPEGWSETIEEIGPRRFRDRVEARVVIDWAALRARVAEVAALTGVGGDTFTVSVTPTLLLDGSTRDGAIDETVAHTIEFPVVGDVITPSAFAPLEGGDALGHDVVESAEMSVFGLDVDVDVARALFGGLALVAVAAVAWLAAVVFGGFGLHEPQRIAARYRSRIVDVTAPTIPPGPVVMVSSIDELARIARAEQTVILHETLGDGAHRYRVMLGSNVYEYETSPEHAGSAAATDPPAPPSSDGDDLVPRLKPDGSRD